MYIRRRCIWLSALALGAAALAAGFGCAPPPSIRVHLESRHELASPALDVQVCDVDGNGRKELAVLSRTATERTVLLYAQKQGVPVLRGTAIIPVPQEYGKPAAPEKYFQRQRFSSGDINGDGRAEIVIQEGGDVLAWSRGALRLAKSGRQLLDELGVKRFNAWVICGPPTNGAIDLIVVQTVAEDLNSIRVFGSAHGTFRRRAAFSASTGTRLLALDAKRDADYEIVWSNDRDPDPNPGVLRFDLRTQARSRLALSGQVLLAGDMLGRGDRDLLVFSKSESPFASRGQFVIASCYGSRVGRYETSGLDASLGPSLSGTVGDIDSDGTSELVLIDPASPKEIQVYSVKR